MKSKLVAAALFALVSLGIASPVLARQAETFKCFPVEDASGSYFLCIGDRGTVIEIGPGR